MQFIPGHFCCDVVWSTVINVHPRLKMGPNMGVARGETRSERQEQRWALTCVCFWSPAAIQALRSVLNSFSVVNRKNMFVYQERATKSVFYLRFAPPRQVEFSERAGAEAAPLFHPFGGKYGLAADLLLTCPDCVRPR